MGQACCLDTFPAGVVFILLDVARPLSAPLCPLALGADRFSLGKALHSSLGLSSFGEWNISNACRGCLPYQHVLGVIILACLIVGA